MGLIGCIVGECATSYHTLLTARIIQGFSSSAFESIMFATIGYTPSLLGLMIAIPTLYINVVYVYLSSILSPVPSRICTSHPFVVISRTAIIAGPIVTNLGWHWLFHILVIFIAVQFVLMVFFCPETTYRRDFMYDIDQVQNENFEKLAIKENRHSNVPEDLERTNSAYIPPEKSYLQRLKPWSGIHSPDNLIKLLLAPFVTLLNVGALYTIVTSGVLVAWYVAVSFIIAAVFSPPPYLFTAAQVGYLSTGPFVGGLLAAVFMAVINDPLIRFLTRRNSGI
jgi:MFS family permease